MKRSLTNAGVLERFFAYLIDLLAIVAVQVVLGALLGQGIGTLAGFIAYLAYVAHFTASAWQATPGQRLLNIHVVHVNGTALTLRDGIERFLAFLIPSLPMYTSALTEDVAKVLTLWMHIVWFVPIIVSDKRMGLHDRLCSTRVVTGKADA